MEPIPGSDPNSFAHREAMNFRQILRKRMLAQRQGLLDSEHERLSALINAHLSAFLTPGQIVAFCWPVRREADLRPAIYEHLRRGGQAALPVIVATDKPMRFRRWHIDTPLSPDRYGIPTPQSGDFLIPDVLLLPFVAIDAAGYRLGYGGGYFDRTLAAQNFDPLTVGVGFECNRIASIKPQPHDQPVSWLLTETGLRRIDRL